MLLQHTMLGGTLKVFLPMLRHCIAAHSSLLSMARVPAQSGLSHD